MPSVFKNCSIYGNKSLSHSLTSWLFWKVQLKSPSELLKLVWRNYVFAKFFRCLGSFVELGSTFKSVNQKNWTPKMAYKMHEVTNAAQVCFRQFPSPLQHLKHPNTQGTPTHSEIVFFWITCFENFYRYNKNVLDTFSLTPTNSTKRSLSNVWKICRYFLLHFFSPVNFYRFAKKPFATPNFTP